MSLLPAPSTPLRSPEAVSISRTKDTIASTDMSEHISVPIMSVDWRCKTLNTTGFPLKNYSFAWHDQTGFSIQNRWQHLYWMSM
eukprot:6930480-Ditylum_brightwellii.AAC.1